jgi:hypothetical protein
VSAGTQPDLDRLLKLRLVVARVGEMDNAGWWSTKGQLGRSGASVLGRGFPRTHLFAQARSVFAVATHRCAEVFDHDKCVTLWRLPEVLEDELDARWEHWLDDVNTWKDFFGRLAQIQGPDLLAALRTFELIRDADANAVGLLLVSPGSRAVPLPGTFRSDDATLTLLAAAFARGEPNALAVPYAELEG